MRIIFYNDGEGRLRAGWRIALFVLGLMILTTATVLGIEAFIGGRPPPGLGRDALAIGTVAVIITLLIQPGRRLMDKRSVISLGLRFDSLAIKDLIFGWLLSGVLAALFFLVLWTAGMLTVNGLAWHQNDWCRLLLSYWALHLIVGYWEELFFRGYLFDNLKAGLGTMMAIVVSCVLYGAIHLVNPGASILSTSVIVLFGFVRLFGLLTTRQLWLSMGMHMGWNFFQGPIFGFAASGHHTYRFIEHTTQGDPRLTGAEFGPEASWIMIPILLLAIGVMFWWSRRFVRPRILQAEPR